MIKSQDLNKYRLPDSPGVYFFKQDKDILYIGRATSLRDRVRSYFNRDLISTRGPLIVDLLFQSNKIDYIKTGSVLESVILEANLIKKYQPRHNTKEKDDKSFNYVVVTNEDFPRILIARGREIEKGLPYKIKEKFGPFTNGESLRNILKIIRRIFPYRDRCVPSSGRPCFNRQLLLCPGVCDGTISRKDYQRIIRKISLLFSGKTDSLRKRLRKEMASLARTQRFEQANEVKNQIFALNHIQDISLISEDQATTGGKFRMEAYDAAHISGTNNVGAMVVMENGELNGSDYRKFNIRNSRGNDVGALQEILERRLKHSEWPYPNMIVVDGGLGQMNIVKKVLWQNSIQIPVTAVVKGADHKPKAIIGQESLIKKYRKEILLINNESHRFAIAFHRQKRSVIL